MKEFQSSGISFTESARRLDLTISPLRQIGRGRPQEAPQNDVPQLAKLRCALLRIASFTRGHPG